MHTRQQVQVAAATVRHVMYRRETAQHVNIQAVAVHIFTVMSRAGVARIATNQPHVTDQMAMYPQQNSHLLTTIYQ